GQSSFLPAALIDFRDKSKREERHQETIPGNIGEMATTGGSTTAGISSASRVNQGKYDGVEALHKRALAIRENTLGPRHPDVASSLNNLAGLLKSQGKYDDAGQLYKRALAIRENTLGPRHPDVASSLNDLAGLLQSQSKYDDAEQLYKRALAIRENTLVPRHPDVASSLNNLAGLLKSQVMWH
ncbi:unnamed protein product, partial [Ascophyllum nodosum]